MAKRKDNAAGKGFQIPIEDVEDDKAAEAKTEEDGQDTESEPEAVEAEVLEEEADGQKQDEAADSEGDIVAEAEAVVEEAAAAAAEGDQLEKALQESAEWQDRYMRLHAEWDTYRRRMSEQRAEEQARATEKLMENLLPVLDDFERTVAYATENGEGGLLDGVKAVQTKLLDALVKGGLEVIDPAGQAYDALEAQAVATVPDEEAFDETVHEVYQKGYKMGRKVIRPAMVTVTTGGPKRPKEESNEDE
ncbi:MAG TPA: nucleotide exchange factor GrpE [Eggerthellaceae bacterium]|nr:nucleotide exchange factor GrpE [Eggerthellaceae bacterium]